MLGYFRAMGNKPKAKEKPAMKKVAGYTSELVPVKFEWLETIISSRAEVLIVNYKKRTSVAGWIVEILSHDEGKEAVLFKSGFKGTVAKVALPKLRLRAPTALKMPDVAVVASNAPSV